MPMPLVGVGLALVLSYIALLTVQVYTPWTEYTPQCADFLPEGAHRHQIGPPSEKRVDHPHGTFIHLETGNFSQEFKRRNARQA